MTKRARGIRLALFLTRYIRTLESDAASPTMPRAWSEDLLSNHCIRVATAHGFTYVNGVTGLRKMRSQVIASIKEDRP